ncbi:hypothetical protein CSC2_45690 [Clostridium zeae]|uniref:Uncharacterized protein n=1 Tax=Clostridium zeae TaxID=2759022 RepID=A0ABQ1EGT5_9CLOT|nr:hypothetical protein [Clostridium zeae]GFZ34043.1 hypothetical protein CSC2_45690 [Clostridium zeae]
MLQIKDPNEFTNAAKNTIITNNIFSKLKSIIMKGIIIIKLNVADTMELVINFDFNKMSILLLIILYRIIGLSNSTLLCSPKKT